MSKRFLTIAAACPLFIGLFSTCALAQGAQGEIVVPVINVFGVGTTVSVPDRGYTSLGGFGGASHTRTEFGPGFGRGLSSRAVAAESGVRVWIHDFQEMEESLAGRRGSDEAAGSSPSGFASRMRQYAAARAGHDQRATRTASREPAREATTFSKTDHAADLLERGQKAEAQGKTKVACLYYKSVISLGATPSAKAARERLNTLEPKLAER